MAEERVADGGQDVGSMLGGRGDVAPDRVQDVVVAIAQALQVPAGVLLAVGTAGHLGQSREDAVPEGGHQRDCGLSGHCGQAAVAGGLRGMDQAAQGASDLAWPDGAGIAFGGIRKVTKKAGLMAISA